VKHGFEAEVDEARPPFWQSLKDAGWGLAVEPETAAAVQAAARAFEAVFDSGKLGAAAFDVFAAVAAFELA